MSDPLEYKQQKPPLVQTITLHTTIQWQSGLGSAWADPGGQAQMDWSLHPGISPLDEEAEVILIGFRVWTLDHLNLIIRVDYTGC